MAKAAIEALEYKKNYAIRQAEFSEMRIGELETEISEQAEIIRVANRTIGEMTLAISILGRELGE